MQFSWFCCWFGDSCSCKESPSSTWISTFFRLEDLCWYGQSFLFQMDLYLQLEELSCLNIQPSFWNGIPWNFRSWSKTSNLKCFSTCLLICVSSFQDASLLNGLIVDDSSVFYHLQIFCHMSYIVTNTLESQIVHWFLINRTILLILFCLLKFMLKCSILNKIQGSFLS